MNSVILFISQLLAKSLNWVIFLLAIVETVLMVRSYMQMKSLKTRIDDLNSSKKGKSVLTHKGGGKLGTEYKVMIERDWREFDSFCDDYQNNSILFSWVSLIIQIFPLLGILGTVTGLFLAMNSNSDWTNAQGLYEGVRFALSSTVLGIFFAVIFKVADIAFSARYLNYIDDGINRYRENYNVEMELPMGGDAAGGAARSGQAPAGNAPAGGASEGNAPAGGASEGNASEGGASEGNASEGEAPKGASRTGHAPAPGGDRG